MGKKDKKLQEQIESLRDEIESFKRTSHSPINMKKSHSYKHQMESSDDYYMVESSHQPSHMHDDDCGCGKPHHMEKRNLYRTDQDRRHYKSYDNRHPFDTHNSHPHDKKYPNQHNFHCSCEECQGKGFYDSRFPSHHHGAHFDAHFKGEHCDVPFKVSPFNFCLPNFRLNFNGLNGNLAFQLFRFKGCKVKVFIDCSESGSTSEIRGVICNVGTNFVDVIKEDKTVVTILIERICKIEWLDKQCNPCPVCCHDDFHDEHCPHCGASSEEEESSDEEEWSDKSSMRKLVEQKIRASLNVTNEAKAENEVNEVEELKAAVDDLKEVVNEMQEAKMKDTFEKQQSNVPECELDEKTEFKPKTKRRKRRRLKSKSEKKDDSNLNQAKDSEEGMDNKPDETPVEGNENTTKE
ncbi:hypothetical protein M3181_20345 [Mesobacillus maritimus]|uniref:hypothetical protein n=1 Tax=Mesobacillus maritimus TaxID=1643336 RepID=UPI00203CBFE5|nr:hypothetical protein [Mesobacillus maritimus]MCM3671313.1 hypothetical protein [Mesobacillus maritimus]